MTQENFRNIMDLLFYAENETSYLSFRKIWKDESLCEHLWNKKANSCGIVNFWFRLDPSNKRLFYIGIKKEYEEYMSQFAENKQLLKY